MQEVARTRTVLLPGTEVTRTRCLQILQYQYSSLENRFVTICYHAIITCWTHHTWYCVCCKSTEVRSDTFCGLGIATTSEHLSTCQPHQSWEEVVVMMTNAANAATTFAVGITTCGFSAPTTLAVAILWTKNAAKATSQVLLQGGTRVVCFLRILYASSSTACSLRRFVALSFGSP